MKHGAGAAALLTVLGIYLRLSLGGEGTLPSFPKGLHKNAYAETSCTKHSQLEQSNVFQGKRDFDYITRIFQEEMGGGEVILQRTALNCQNVKMEQQNTNVSPSIFCRGGEQNYFSTVLTQKV